MKRKAVFMDIDGTLISKGAVSEVVARAIKKARDEGHMFFICTGRSKIYLPQVIRDMDYIDGYVMSCGMRCEVGGKTIYHEAFSHEELRDIAEYVCRKGRASHFEGIEKILSINSERRDFSQVSSCEELMAELGKETVSKIAIDGAHIAEDDPGLFDRFEAFDMGHYSDIVRKGITKATGMQRVLEYTGIPREDCIGIGDGSNDLPMIKYAGLGVAMGNAPEHVKAEADAVTETCENDGVAVMIERYVFGEQHACDK